MMLSGAIVWLTRWEFGVAALLLFGLLLQFAHERMTVILDAHALTGLKALGWDEHGKSGNGDPNLWSGVEAYARPVDPSAPDAGEIAVVTGVEWTGLRLVNFAGSPVSELTLVAGSNIDEVRLPSVRGFLPGSAEVRVEAV